VRDLSKKKLDQLASGLEAIQASFAEDVTKLAELARAEILPYFKKHNLSFVAGGGWGWSISKPSADTAPYYRPDDHVEDDDLPPHILALLRLEVGYNNRLGDHIQAINRGEW
jgi:hypothetical protein